ncbi:hypothetical protein D1007_52446 [Hordeum vulgare]|nr:hypothetical protein D1007_52446 [Hordeum vulgare]
MEQLLCFDKYKVVGFDIEYTGGHARHHQKVVVIHLRMGHDILVYHYYLGTRPCERFTMFVNGCDYIFDGCLGDKEKHKDSLVDLAMSIIDPYYRGMNDVYKKKKVA